MKQSLFILAMLVCFAATAQQQWKLERDEDGIKVFSAASTTSKYKSIRVQCVLQGTIRKLISILQNVSRHVDWVYKTEEAHMLKTISPAEFIYYSKTHMPWPVKNRDGIYHLKITYDTARNSLVVNGVGEPNYLPENDGLVRIPFVKTNWNVTEAVGHITVDYFIEVEPGGSLPAWLVNSFADKGPYESFKKLAELLKN